MEHKKVKVDCFDRNETDDIRKTKPNDIQSFVRQPSEGRATTSEAICEPACGESLSHSTIQGLRGSGAQGLTKSWTLDVVFGTVAV